MGSGAVSRGYRLAVERADFGAWLEAVSPTWRWDWPHLRLVRSHLDAVTAGRIRRLMISMPPRHGKSELSTIRYPVWRMEREQDCRVAVGCYDQTFAERFGRRSRRIARGRFAVSDERSAAKEWETFGGGVYRSCGVGNPPTGEGFNLLVIDDPVRSREQAESAAHRERVWEWYTDDLYTRLEPDAAVILIMTRWHEDDLAGRILDSEQAQTWTVLNLPAVAEVGDPLGRAKGEALCPERYDLAALQDIRVTQGEYSFGALYQGRPTAREGNLFRVSMLDVVEAVPAELPSVRAWDLAATAGDGDWTAGVKLAGPDSDGRYYVLDVVRGQWEPSERDRVIRQTADLDKAAVRIWGPQDPGAAGKEVAQTFVRRLAGYRVTTATVTGDKVTRADSLASQVNAGNVRLVGGEWVRAYLDELRQFPQGRHDDQVDASASAFGMLTAAVQAAGAPSVPSLPPHRPGTGLAVGRRGAGIVGRRR